jgi:hypothetical protein
MKKRFTVTLTEDVVKQAKKKAIDENKSLSAMVEDLLVRHIQETADFKVEQHFSMHKEKLNV